MKELKLSQILRYILSGGFFLLSTYLSHLNKLPEKTFISGLGGATFVFGLALLCGSLIYILHRATFYIWVYRRMRKFVSRKAVKRKIAKSEAKNKSEIDWDFTRWEHRMHDNSPIKYMSEWADQVHFLYTSFIAVFSGVIFGIALPDGTNFSGGKPAWAPISLLILGGILLVTALFTHYRYLSYEIHIFWPADESPPN